MVSNIDYTKYNKVLNIEELVRVSKENPNLKNRDLAKYFNVSLFNFYNIRKKIGLSVPTRKLNTAELIEKINS